LQQILSLLAVGWYLRFSLSYVLEQIPMRQIEDVSRQISEWLRISFAQFLSAESPGLMGIKDLGEFKILGNRTVPRNSARNGQGIDQKQLTASVLGGRSGY
jgi:hypothetical protein